MTGMPTPERNSGDRLLRLERDVARLTQLLSDRRAALWTADQPVRLAVTVRPINPAYDPEDSESSPFAPYPDPPATILPIRFLDALDNATPAADGGDPPAADAYDQDFDHLDRGDDGSEQPAPQTHAMHVREFVPLGMVVVVMEQRPAASAAEISEPVQWWFVQAIDGAVAVLNDYGSTIPPHAVLRLTGKDDDNGGVLKANQPNSTTTAIHAVNSRYEIAAGAVGLAFVDERPHVFKCSISPDTPAFAETWGPQDATFELHKNQTSKTKVQVYKNLPDKSGHLWGRFKVDGGSPVILGKAKLYSGTWPTLKDFSESVASAQPATQRQWSFQKGTGTYTSANVYNQLSFTAVGSAETDYVTAYNLANHYVPENAIVELFEIDGKYWFQWRLPPLVIGTLDATLSAGSGNYALMTIVAGQYLYGSAKLRVYGDFLAVGTTIASGNTVGAAYIETGFHDNAVFEPRYVVTSLKGCPA